MADFRDDFTGETVEVDLAAHVPSGPGSGWRREGANADAVGVNPSPVNALRTRTKGDEIYWPQVGGADFAPGPDQQVIADWVDFQSGSTPTFMLGLRVTDINNWIGVVFIGTGNIGVRVIKRVAGVDTTLIQASGATRATAGNLIRLDATGEVVELFYSDDNGLNWTSQGSVTETFNNGETKCAVLSINGGGLNNTFIDWLEFNGLSAGGVTGIGAGVIGGLSASVIGALRIDGAGAMALPATQGLVEGLIRVAGGAATLLRALSPASEGALRSNGVGAAILPGPLAAGVSGGVAGIAAVRMSAISAAGDASLHIAGSGAALIPDLEPAAAAALRIDGAVAAVLATPGALGSETVTININASPRRTLIMSAGSRRIVIEGADRRLAIPADSRRLKM